MKVRFYNSLTHQMEDFAPLNPPEVAMYNCGPTVYDYTHIGNFRSFLFADVLRRFLEFAGLRVNQVMNITDVGHMTEDQLADGAGEDKMQLAAKRLKESKKQGEALIDNPEDPYEIARFFTSAFVEDAKKLNIKIAFDHDDNPAKTRMPHATDHVAAHMIPMIQTLIEKDHAYVARDGAVYFAVETFPSYGRLSGNTLDQLQGGAGGRVLDQHQQGKRHPADFLLWKPDAHHLMKWDSPWGVGYPGWHIECSAMARALLDRDVIDIHTGGEDNIFPHHECEIAQSCCVTGQAHFARFWLHARFLRVQGRKMSKSEGNFYTLRDLMSGAATGRPVHPAIVRYELIRVHYRSNLDLTFKGLQDAAYAVSDLRRFAQQLDPQAGGATADVDVTHPVLKRFAQALADDLNISAALAVVHEWMHKPGKDAAVNRAVLARIDSVLGVLQSPVLGAEDVLAKGALDEDELRQRLSLIEQARKVKDYAAADGYKQALRELDYDVRDTAQGAVAQPRPVVVDAKQCND